MLALIDWILNLFRSEDAARAFVAAPEQALRDAGLAGVTPPSCPRSPPPPCPAWCSATVTRSSACSVRSPTSTASRRRTPRRSTRSGRRPRPTLRRRRSPRRRPSRRRPNTELASRNSTDLASHNDTSLFSPPQDAGANAQQGAFNLGFGDITLGDKTSQSATNGGVVVGEDASGDIVSGDGAVLGNGNASPTATSGPTTAPTSPPVRAR